MIYGKLIAIGIANERKQLFSILLKYASGTAIYGPINLDRFLVGVGVGSEL